MTKSEFCAFCENSHKLIYSTSLASNFVGLKCCQNKGIPCPCKGQTNTKNKKWGGNFVRVLCDNFFVEVSVSWLWLHHLLPRVWINVTSFPLNECVTELCLQHLGPWTRQPCGAQPWVWCGCAGSGACTGVGCPVPGSGLAHPATSPSTATAPGCSQSTGGSCAWTGMYTCGLLYLKVQSDEN